MTDTYTIAADELRQFIEQIEQLESEKKDISAQIGEIYSAAKARGYDQKALKVIVKMRAADNDELAEKPSQRRARLAADAKNDSVQQAPTQTVRCPEGSIWDGKGCWAMNLKAVRR